MKNMKKVLSVFLAVLMLFTTFSLVMPVFAQYKAEIEADTEMEIVDEEKEAHIISEDVDKRTENTKQFLMKRIVFQVKELLTSMIPRVILQEKEFMIIRAILIATSYIQLPIIMTMMVI